MNRRFLLVALLGFFSIIVIEGCTKLDTTNLGSDLLPVVDNVNTFADTINIQAYQGIFNDTTTSINSDDHVLGKISNDPVFGTTSANVYLQVKPAKFPYSIAPAGDTLVSLTSFDSIVLTLAYKRAWGDTAMPITVAVKELPENIGGKWDSIYVPKPLTYAPPTGASVLYNGAATYQLPDIRTFGDKVKFAHGKDSAVNQIRIRLSDAYGLKFFQQDSASIARPGYQGNAFSKDSLFRKKFEGLAIEAVNGNSVLTLSLADPNTRLEIHYRKKRNNVIDTTYTSLKVLTSLVGAVLPSSAANKVTRNYSGTPFFPVTAGTKDEIYLQTTPGTYTDLVIPRLQTYKDTNRIIHRAQIRITQVPDANALLDKNFSPPSFLYLDLKDTTTLTRHKPVYIDLSPSSFYNPDNKPAGYFFPESVDFGYFGGYAKKRQDPLSGREITYYDFTLTRYLQQMVTKHNTNYNLRVFAPYSFSYPQYDPRIIGYPNNLATGRVKVGGTNGNYKMQLVIVWSKVKQL